MESQLFHQSAEPQISTILSVLFHLSVLGIPWRL